MYFVLKKLQLMICKNWKIHFWKLTLGFDRLKTTPDRSLLAAGCTTTLMSLGMNLSNLLTQCLSYLIIY